MTSTRVTTLIVFLVGSVGFALGAIATSTSQALAGGTMVMASAIYLVRHLWRESDRKRKYEMAAQRDQVSVVLTELQTTNTNIERSLREVESLRDDVRQGADRADEYFRAILEYVAQVALELESARQELSEMRGGLERLENQSERRAAHTVAELSGVIGVYSALSPQVPYPPFGGWSISGDSASRLVELILTDSLHSIIDVGSGLSTLLIAQALELLGTGHCIAFEHEKPWMDRSNELLAQHGLSHRALVAHAPLVDVEVGGEMLRWYDISSVDLPDQIDMLFIDGPPKATGPLARYPALPLMIDRLGPTGVILMDDADRPDERLVVKRWKTEYPDLVVVHYSDSKGTVEIRRVPA